jgi:hypothetical protein
MKIQMLVYPGMTLLDLVGPLQIWASWPDVEFQFVWKRAEAVETDSTLKVTATTAFADAWEAPRPGDRMSSTVTATPRAARASATAAPMTPAPMMMVVRRELRLRQKASGRRQKCGTSYRAPSLLESWQATARSSLVPSAFCLLPLLPCVQMIPVQHRIEHEEVIA